MMKNVKNNTVTLIGFIAQEPRVFLTKDGKEAVGLAMSTRNSYYDPAEKAYKNLQTIWHNDLVAFHTPVVELAKTTQKGQRVKVFAELKYREVKTAEGLSVNTVSLIVDAIEMLPTASQHLKQVNEKHNANQPS